MRTMQNLEYITMERGDELSECRCDVGLSMRCFRLRSSKIDVSTFEDQGSMCRPSKINVLTFEDR